MLPGSSVLAIYQFLGPYPSRLRKGKIWPVPVWWDNGYQKEECSNQRIQIFFEKRQSAGCQLESWGGWFKRTFSTFFALRWDNECLVFQLTSANHVFMVRRSYSRSEWSLNLNIRWTAGGTRQRRTKVRSPAPTCCSLSNLHTFAQQPLTVSTELAKKKLFTLPTSSWVRVPILFHDIGKWLDSCDW